MSIDAYFNPEFNSVRKGVFFLITLLAVIAVNLLVRGMDKAVNGKEGDGGEGGRVFVQMFYEMMICGCCGLMFASSYIICNHLYAMVSYAGAGGFEVFMQIWGDWKDFALLILILISCLINTVLDRVFIPLKLITGNARAAVRMLGMFYVIVILVILNFLGDENEYNPVMMYYLGLMIGRFVYFDASLADFLKAMGNVIKNLPLMLLGLLLSGALSVFGFHMGYFLEKNYYIVGVLYTHLFILAAVFIINLADMLFKRRGTE